MSDKVKTVLGIAVPLVLVLALIVVSVWGVQQQTRADSYQNSTESMYRRAFIELADNLSDLEATLSKLMVSGSRNHTIIMLDDIWRLSGASVSLMSQIPSSHVDTYELNRFIVQVGDYAHTLMENLIGGTIMSQEDSDQLVKLHETCVSLANEVRGRVDSDDVPIDLLTNDDYFEPSSKEYEDSEGVEKFPTLIYDGPYSESTEKLEPKGVSGDEISEDEAMQKAMEYAPGSQLESAGASDGNIPAYDFSGTLEDGRSVDISVTKKGGHLLWMMSSAKGQETGVPEESLTEKYRNAGLDYLDKHGVKGLTGTYAQYYAGVALINYAATQDDVILYSDLIKLWIDRETLEIVGFDARNYLYSHVERNIEEPKLSVEDAERMLNPNLTVASKEMAFIPITPSNERLCYEFKCTLGDQAFIVYIDAITGDELEIFRIIDSEDGQLVI